MKNIEGKVVWITGASSGIGEALAIALAKSGAKLILSARRESELIRVKNTLNLAESDILVLPLDMDIQSEFQGHLDTILAKFGQLDILVNNAGVSQRGDVLNTDMATYRSIFELNFFSVIALTKIVLQQFIKQGSGKFVVTSSVSGKLGSPNRAGYSASKHALHGFYDSLRSEVFTNNISVLLVCPGYVKTNISKNAFGINGERHGKMDQNQENGIAAEDCADQILKGISKNKSEIYIGGKEVFGIYLKRFFPKILEKIVRSQAPK